MTLGIEFDTQSFMSSEMIEIYNEQGEQIGVRPRDEVHHRGMWHRGVHCFLFNDSDQLLVQRRAEGCDTFAGAYDCSVSEHLSVGEGFKEALVRGCQEELGINPFQLKKLVSYKMQYGPTDNMICDLYSAKIDERNLQINKNEVASIEFLELTEIIDRLNNDPSKFTSWFREQLCWMHTKPYRFEII